MVPYIVVGLHDEFSLTGSFFGLPITMNVLPRINLHGIFSCLIFSNINKLTEAGWGEFGSRGDIKEGEFIQPIENFYMTDVISRASATMAECTEVALEKKEKAA